MKDNSSKVLMEFSLTDSGRQRLQDFFDGEGKDLLTKMEAQRAYKEALRKLQDVLREVLPDQAKESLIEIFSGKSSTALLINNLPHERSFSPGLQNAYAHHISRALYEMHGTYEVTLPLLRKRGRTRDSIVGEAVHRDYHRRDRIGMLAAKHNGEMAETAIIHLDGALDTIPEGNRKKMAVNIAPLLRNREMTTLDDALIKLRSENADSIERLRPEDWGIHQAAYDDAVARNSARVILQPGKLLIWDEKKLFHQAFDGLHLATSGESDIVLPNGVELTRSVLRAMGRGREI